MKISYTKSLPRGLTQFRSNLIYLCKVTNVNLGLLTCVYYIGQLSCFYYKGNFPVFTTWATFLFLLQRRLSCFYYIGNFPIFIFTTGVTFLFLLHELPFLFLPHRHRITFLFFTTQVAFLFLPHRSHYLEDF